MRVLFEGVEIVRSCVVGTPRQQLCEWIRHLTGYARREVGTLLKKEEERLTDQYLGEDRAVGQSHWDVWDAAAQRIPLDELKRFAARLSFFCRIPSRLSREEEELSKELLDEIRARVMSGRRSGAWYVDVQSMRGRWREGELYPEMFKAQACGMQSILNHEWFRYMREVYSDEGSITDKRREFVRAWEELRRCCEGGGIPDVGAFNHRVAQIQRERGLDGRDIEGIRGRCEEIIGVVRRCIDMSRD